MTPKRAEATCFLTALGAAKIAASIGMKTRFVLSAFAGVRFAADAVWRRWRVSRGLLCWMEPNDIAPVLKRFHNFFGGFDFIERNGIVALLIFNGAAQRV